MNKAILIGNLTRDPEGGITQNGVSWCRFCVAINRRHADQNGERQADYLNVVAWRTTAENCVRYLSKGSKVAVEGRIETRQFEGDDGQRKYYTEIMAESVEFLGTRGGSSGGESND